MSRCPQCERPLQECACQASLLERLPEWYGELQQRVDAYRARRGKGGAVAARVLPWRPVAEPTVPVPTASVPAEEIASAPPPLPSAAPVTRGPALANAQVASAPARVPVALPAAIMPRRDRHQDALELLQLPLPMLLPKEEAVALPPSAPRALRAHAALMDALIVLLGAAVFGLSAWANHNFALPEAHWLRATASVWVGVPVAMAAIYLWLCNRCGGATVGMRSLGLRVSALDGGDPEPEQLRRRAWASLVSLAALGLGFVWMYCDAQGLTWHDVMSDTCVVRDED